MLNMIESDSSVDPEFGEPGTEGWFGSVDAVNFLTNVARGQDLSSAWVRRNAKAALERRQSLGSDHPFRSDDAELKEIIYLNS